MKTPFAESLEQRIERTKAELKATDSDIFIRVTCAAQCTQKFLERDSEKYIAAYHNHIAEISALHIRLQKLKVKLATFERIKARD